MGTKFNNTLNPNARPYIPPPSTFNYSQCLLTKRKHILRIGTLNARSWLSKADEVSNLFATSHLDILGITETWLTSKVANSLLLPTANYTILRKDRCTDNIRRGGGVAFLIHPSIPHSHRPEHQPSDPSVEIVCVQITYRDSPTYIFCCYRPPHQSHDLFHRSLTTCIQSVKDPRATLILLGDFNARHSTWLPSDPTTTSGRSLSETIDTLGLTQVVCNLPTRYSPTGTSFSLLDLVISNKPTHIQQLTVLPTISDHCPVIFDLALRTPQELIKRTHSMAFDFARTNWKALNDHIWSLPLLKAVQEADSTDEAWVSWIGMVEDAIRKFVPQLPHRTSRKNKPWFTIQHHHLRQRRDRLFKAAKRLRSTEAWTAYRLARNSFVAAIRKAKRKFYDSMSSSLRKGKGTHTWWKKAKALCKINHPFTPIPGLHGNNRVADTNEEKACILGELFASYSQTTQSPHSSLDITDTAPPQLAKNFTIKPPSEAEVFQELSNVSTHRSTTGILCNHIIHKTAEVTTQSLTALFCRSLRESTLPQAWKAAIIVPIFKGKGDRDNPENYRPISLLNGVAKCYEHIVSRQLYSFVEDNGLLSDKQFGFRRQKSTTDQLLRITSTISTALDRGSTCDGLFLDLSKAFDRVSHPLIMKSVSKWCSPSACAWIQDFISDRTMQVQVGQSLSAVYHLTAGVPQGSHLGPLLFNLSIDSLARVPQSSDMTLFADDSNMICVSSPGTSRADHTAALQRDIDNCVKWSEETNTVFNASKCSHMRFSKQRASKAVVVDQVRMKTHTLTQSTTHRHLGISLSPNLDLSPHIRNATHRFRGRVFLLCTMACLLPFSTVSLLYKCYVRPLLEYAVPVWFCSLTSSQSTILDRLQATMARAYLHSKLKHRPDWLTPKESLNYHCNWESLAWRRQILSLKYFHHLFYEFPSLLMKFNFRVSSNPRHPTSLVLPKSGSYMCKSSLFVLAVAWNNLPEEIRSVKSPFKFKKSIRILYRDCRYSLSGIANFGK